jgi:hypothetical protein
MVGWVVFVCGETWKRVRREEGPAERRMGEVGWKDSVVIEDCKGVISEIM